MFYTLLSRGAFSLSICCTRVNAMVHQIIYLFTTFASNKKIKIPLCLIEIFSRVKNMELTETRIKLVCRKSQEKTIQLKGIIFYELQGLKS